MIHFFIFICFFSVSPLGHPVCVHDQCDQDGNEEHDDDHGMGHLLPCEPGRIYGNIGEDYFFVCNHHGNDFTEMDCGPGSLFDPATRDCSIHDGEESCSDGEIRGTNGDAFYLVCEDDNWNTVHCSSRNTYSASAMRCEPSSDPRRRGMPLPAPPTCYPSSPGSCAALSCSTGSVWDSRNSNCVSPGFCYGKSNGFYLDPNNPSVYFFCWSGMTFYGSCPSPLVAEINSMGFIECKDTSGGGQYYSCNGLGFYPSLTNYQAFVRCNNQHIKSTGLCPAHSPEHCPKYPSALPLPSIACESSCPYTLKYGVQDQADCDDVGKGNCVCRKGGNLRNVAGGGCNYGTERFKCAWNPSLKLPGQVTLGAWLKFSYSYNNYYCSHY